MKYERKSGSKALFMAKIGLLALGLLCLGHAAYVAQALPICYSYQSRPCEEPHGSCPPPPPCSGEWFSTPASYDWPVMAETGYWELMNDHCTLVECATWMVCTYDPYSGHCHGDPDSEDKTYADTIRLWDPGCPQGHGT